MLPVSDTHFWIPLMNISYIVVFEFTQNSIQEDVFKQEKLLPCSTNCKKFIILQQYSTEINKNIKNIKAMWSSLTSKLTKGRLWILVSLASHYVLLGWSSQMSHQF